MCEYSWYNHSLRKCSLCILPCYVSRFIILTWSSTNEGGVEFIFLFKMFHKSVVLELNLKVEEGSPLVFCMDETFGSSWPQEWALWRYNFLGTDLLFGLT
jgi:hypothetical protein